MGKDRGIIDNKYYNQVTELTRLYDTVYKVYRELAKLEKNNKKESDEYKSLVDLLKACFEIERREFKKFDNLNSAEMTDMIKMVAKLYGEEQENILDKTCLYTTNKIKRLLSRIRDYSFLRNDTYDMEKPIADENEDKTFQVQATNGMYLNIRISDLKRLGFTYNEEKQEFEEDEDELVNIKATNDAMYNKEKLINANFYTLLEEQIAKTKAKKYKNELIDYKYNLIYNSVSLEAAFLEGKNIEECLDLYKGVVCANEDVYPTQYENVYSNVIENEIEKRITELKSKVYEGIKANPEEAFEDTIDMLYIKSLMNSLITENSQQHIREFTNAAKNEARTFAVKANLNFISETIENIISLNTKETNKELKLKQ